jgi:ribonuclease E
LIYGDSDLIKRAIRDIYNKEIDEIIVEGEASFRAARTFMKLLMPTHARKIQPYQDTVPLFQRYGVEDQLSAMYQPVVQLKSGGYLVINPTEALVSIDINSGRSTREHNIEQTAFATNIEAAHEIARQLRLRDMAGLVVIDFIDMESSGHIRKVEKAMKDALRNDRARIQVGRISGFGLLEMSRQRLRTGVLEASTRICEHCEGTGLMRTAASAGLSALRMLEDEAARGRGDRLCLRAGREAAIYVLNRKRREIGEVEARYGVQIEVMIDAGLEGARMAVESSGNRPIPRPQLEAPAQYEDDDDDLLPLEEEEPEAFAQDTEEDGPDTMRSERPERSRSGRDDEDASGRKRRRRRSRGARRDGGASLAPVGDDVVGDAASDELEGEGELGEAVASDEIEEAEGAAPGGDEGEGGARRRRGRRGRRGGRGRSGEGAERGSADTDAVAEDSGFVDGGTADAGEAFNADAVTVTEALLPEDADVGIAAIAPGESRSEETGVLVPDAREAQAALAEEERPKTRRRPRAKKPVGDEAPAAAESAPVVDVSDIAETVADAPPAKPKRTRRKAADVPAAPLEQTLPLAPSQVGVLDDGPASAGIGGTVSDGEANADAALATATAAVSGNAVNAEPTTAADAAPADEAPDGAGGEPAKSRSGWWQRTFG